MRSQRTPATNSLLWTLFITFFKIGACTFGGGYAMIPIIHREIVEHHQWISEEEMLDLLAIAESTPGPIAINSATFIGCRQAGLAGAIFATLGTALPSFLIISVVSIFYAWFKEIPWVFYAFEGIKSAVIVLIISAILKLTHHSKFTPLALCLAMGAFVFSAFLNADAILVLITAAMVGMATQRNISGTKEEDK